MTTLRQGRLLDAIAHHAVGGGGRIVLVGPGEASVGDKVQPEAVEAGHLLRAGTGQACDSARESLRC